jgi:hypothetical protein
MLLHADRVNHDLPTHRRAAGPGQPPGRLARMAARLRSHALDDALAEGADPSTSRQLAAHAARITATSMRDDLAASLDSLARSADEPRFPGRVLPSRAAVRANATELHALAALLRGHNPVSARGVAMLRVLVTDGTGPAYTDRNGSVLARGLGSARAAVAG